MGNLDSWEQEPRMSVKDLGVNESVNEVKEWGFGLEGCKLIALFAMFFSHAFTQTLGRHHQSTQ